MPITKIATHKIFLSVIFISAAIIGALFIVHSPQNETTTLSANEGVIFPAPREIKAFQLETNDQTFTEKNLLNHWTLVFFGFTHCSNICPITLGMLNNAYNKLHPTYPNLQIAFISLDPERDTQKTLQQYTQTFNANFIGATGKMTEIHKLQSQFGIFSERDNSSTNYQLQHTSSILLINPQGQWAGVFNNGMNPEQFVQAFKRGIS